MPSLKSDSEFINSIFKHVYVRATQRVAHLSQKINQTVHIGKFLFLMQSIQKILYWAFTICSLVVFNIPHDIL